jgi:hypothetical protein
VGEALVQRQAPETAPAPAPVEAPELFVQVTPQEPEPLLLQVAVTEAPPEAPGAATASALRLDGNGNVMWVQYSVSSETPEAEIVIAPVTQTYGWGG